MGSLSIKGVIFDLDGTLYHMKWYMRPIMFCLLIPRGGWLPRYMRIRERVAGKDFNTQENLMKTLSELLALDTGSTPETCNEWMREPFYSAFLGVMPLMRRTRPGLSSMLRHLRGRDIHRAVVSDFGHVSQRLSRLGINPSLFDAIAACEQQGALKPAVRPFKEIIDKWNIPAHNTLVIGDRIDTDGEAAKAAGMQFMQITDNARHPGGMRRWNEIRDFLLTL